MLLGFKPQFEPYIINGLKSFTMRKARKINPKIGETLYMYKGLRTSKCQLITKEYKLHSIHKAYIDIRFGVVLPDEIQMEGVPIRHINDSGKLVRHGAEYAIQVQVKITLDGKQVVTGLFVESDGFKSLEDFVRYWTHDYELIKYKGKIQKGSYAQLCGEMELYAWQDISYVFADSPVFISDVE